MLHTYRRQLVALLRIGLGALFGYFGFLAIRESERQFNIWIASWITDILPFITSEFIFVWGILQVLVALCLVFGVYIQYASFVAAGMLVGIIISLGFNELAYRDAVLAIAAILVAVQETHVWAIHAE